MERKVGEIFTYEGKTYQVVQSIQCEKCAFHGKPCVTLQSVTGSCLPEVRKDKISVMFKEIKNMEIKNNQLTINIPEGMEIDLENSDLAKGIIKFKTRDITYNDVYNELNDTTIAVNTYFGNEIKLRALVKLINIARYYNKDWKYDVTKEEYIGYMIVYDGSIKAPNYTIRRIEACANIYYGNVIFKNEADAQNVIDNPNFRNILDTIYKN